MMRNEYIDEAIVLLQQLIRTPSFSGEEEGTAGIIEDFFYKKGIPTQRLFNNIIVKNKNYSDTLPLIILNSHHDTVTINEGWTVDPFGAELDGDKIYGRGSNDAGGALVSLIITFCQLYHAKLPFNLILIASGEEENFGVRGVSSVLKKLNLQPALGIIGEPTDMNLAIAEKGLIVIDAVVTGVAGHAARDIGENAIYKALNDIDWIRSYDWKKVSEVLGKTKTTVTKIKAGSQHNVIPDRCEYVIDCRINEKYTLAEVLDTLQKNTIAELIPRSLRWHPSGISVDHPIVQRGVLMGRETFGSPTLSDQVHFNCPTIKIGPGQSERSHTADEYICRNEIDEAIGIYMELLKDLIL